MVLPMPFDQTFAVPDLAVVALLVVLEGVLSIDNALVLGLLAKRLPKREQARALTWGLIGAFAFRFISIATAQFLLKYRIVKLVGGLYLAYVALKYFWENWRERHHAASSSIADGSDGDKSAAAEARQVGFWSTVFVIELTDIAFAVDSILAAIALVGPPPEGHPANAFHPKLWVVVTGGILGVILMRYAAVVFIKLLERFPRFETAAYLLVMVIGGKLVLDWQFNTNQVHVLDFHSPSSPAFWVFWILMLCCFCVGFIPKRQKDASTAEPVTDLPAEVHQVRDSE
jgi:YkoY family integral membrane protein